MRMTCHRLYFVRLLLVLTLLVGGCAPFFAGGVFQRMELFFELLEAIQKGQPYVAHTWFFPGKVAAKNRWVRVSGAIEAPKGGKLPSQVTAEAKISDVNTSQVKQTIRLKVKIKKNGNFKVSKKLTKDIPANSLMTVTVNPSGSDLAKGSKVTFCVDMFKSKGDIKKNAPCTGGGGVTFAQIQTDIFNPSCALSGCHSGSSSPEGLDLDAGASYDNIVNVPATQDSNKDRIEPGDPDASYLINKVRGDAGISGARMPPSGGGLSGAKIGMLEKWVEAGAKNN